MRTLVPALAILLALQLPLAPHGGDGCDEPPNAQGVYAFPASCHGTVPGGFGTPADAFQFTVPERARVVFEVTNDATRFHDTVLVDLIDPDGNHVSAPNV